MPSELKQKATKGFFWGAIGKFSNEGVSFLFTIILARLLMPSDYGIIAMVGIFFAIARTFVNCGFGAALIRKKDRTDADLNTCFYFNIAVAGISYILLFLASPFIADFFNQPILSPLMKVMGITLIIGSFGIVQNTQFAYNINFKTTAKISLTSNVIGGLCAIVLAYKGYGVWALVLKEMIASIVGTSLLWLASSWRPKWMFSKDSFKYLFGFGSKLLASYLIGTVYENIYPLVIGKFYTPAQLGNYTRGLQWAQLPATNITGIIQSVTFPVMSEIQDDEKRLEINYRRLLRTAAFIVFPVMIGLAAVASPLIRVVLTPKWDGAILYLQIICFGLMWYPIHAINLNLLQVKGRSDLFLRLEIIKRLTGLAILCISVSFGITAMCIGMVVDSLFALVANTYYNGKMMQLGFLKQMTDVLPIFINSLVMGGIVLFTTEFISYEWLKLLTGILLGVIIYATGSYLFTRRELQEVTDVLRRR